MKKTIIILAAIIILLYLSAILITLASPEPFRIGTVVIGVSPSRNHTISFVDNKDDIYYDLNAYYYDNEQYCYCIIEDDALKEYYMIIDVKNAIIEYETYDINDLPIEMQEVYMTVNFEKPNIFGYYTPKNFN